MIGGFEAGKKLLRGGYSQYTPTGKSYFVKNGAYGKEPHVGGIVYFYSKGTGRVAHVGAVVSVRKSFGKYEIETVEGNTSSGKSFDRNGGCVAKKKYSFYSTEVGNGQRIDGFGNPLFDDGTCTKEEFLEVLQTEIGYEEKASNAGLEGQHTNVGKNNYTKFGAWYAKSCGGDHPAYWCAQFISWCAWQACELHRKKTFTGWAEFDGKWMYEVQGVVQKNKWMNVDGRWYVFDGAGYMVKGWFESNDEWYWLNPEEGSMISGQWIEIGDDAYYLTENGVMAKNCYVKSRDKGLYYFVDKDGIYQKDYDTDTPDLDKFEVVK